MEKFLQEKKLLGTDPFVDEDFEKLSELGAGNGGAFFPFLIDSTNKVIHNYRKFRCRSLRASQKDWNDNGKENDTHSM